MAKSFERFVPSSSMEIHGINKRTIDVKYGSVKHGLRLSATYYGYGRVP